ncbi:glycosyltransferase family 2 protein [Alienimonas sp. DA493]|uniref:glycosyltransferase family 2 protein n=1 Tax=Alienimonas sp. DA493 TaxID=3373605 RepID=UPI0037550749
MTAPSSPPAPSAPDRPRFGIVTPSYNQGAYLRETIESVLSQEGLGTEFDLDYAVIDGGSTDGSAEIIREYEDRLTFWCSEKDRGQSHAINKGFDHVTKDPAAIAAWLNSDDVYLPGALKKVAAYWREHAPDALIGHGRKVDADGTVDTETRFGDYSREGLMDWGQNSFMQPACFMSRRVWDDVGGLDESLDQCLDVNLWLRIAERYRFETLREPLAEAKAHAAAKTSNACTAAEGFAELSLMILRHGGEDVVRRKLAEHNLRLRLLDMELRTASALPVLGLIVRAARRIARGRLARDPRFRRPGGAAAAGGGTDGG